MANDVQPGKKANLSLPGEYTDELPRLSVCINEVKFAPPREGPEAQAPFATVDDTQKLTVKYKGVTLLDQFQTSYAPSAGRLVLAGRTGGANENTHVDNISITTVPADTFVIGPVTGTPVGFNDSTRVWRVSRSSLGMSCRIGNSSLRS